LRLLGQQGVIRQTETARREQVGPVAVVDKRPRLANQPVDDVPVGDLVLAATSQPRQLLHPPTGVPDLDPLREDTSLHPLADQPRRHRVDVALDVDRAAAVHPHLSPLTRLQTPHRQRSQSRSFLGQTLLATRVELTKQPPQELLVGGPTVEVAVPPQQQRLLQRPLKAMVTLLHVAVLVALAGLDGLALQSVVPQQALITVVEAGPFGPRRDGGGEPIRAMKLGHAAQLEQGVLQALAQTLQALREADGAGLPVAVSQHEVVDHVVERRAVDGHLQIGAVGEVAGRQPSGVMVLGEEHLLGLTVQRSPGPHPPLQGSQLGVGEPARMTALQIDEQRLGLQAGVESQQLLQLGPDVGEGIGSRRVVAFHDRDLAGQAAEAAILASGLGIESRLGRGPFPGHVLKIEPKEQANLLISDHREYPRVGRALAGVRLLADREIELSLKSVAIRSDREI
jgi:hypothetical protein